MLTNAIAFFSLKKRMTLVSFLKSFVERSEDQREDLKLWAFQISFLLIALITLTTVAWR